MGIYYSTQSYIYNQMVWVSEDTIYKLPSMGVNPDSITAGGFSGGSFYATIFHVVNSATIKGVHLRAGGPYSFGYDHSEQETLDDQYVQEAIALAQAKSDEGLIDNVSNLSGAPVKIMSCL
jgi:predicted esterase